MKRTAFAFAVLAFLAAAFAASVSPTPAHAVPPTVTPSPGYDARLQEQRRASRAYVEPVKPVSPRRGKKGRAR